MSSPPVTDDKYQNQMSCHAIDKKYRLVTFPIDETILTIAAYTLIISLATLIAAYMYRIFMIFTEKNSLLPEKNRGISDLQLELSKDTVVRLTELTGGVTGGDPGGAKSQKLQLTKMEERMKPGEFDKPPEKPKSFGLSKEVDSISDEQM